MEPKNSSNKAKPLDVFEEKNQTNYSASSSNDHVVVRTRETLEAEQNKIKAEWLKYQLRTTGTGSDKIMALRQTHPHIYDILEVAYLYAQAGQYCPACVHAEKFFNRCSQAGIHLSQHTIDKKENLSSSSNNDAEAVGKYIHESASYQSDLSGQRGHRGFLGNDGPLGQLASASSSNDTATSSSCQTGPPGGAVVPADHDMNTLQCQYSHEHCLMAHKCCICQDQREQRGDYYDYVEGGGMREMTRHDLYCPSCKSYLQRLTGQIPSQSDDMNPSKEECWRSYEGCELDY